MPVTRYLRVLAVCLPLVAAGLPRAGLAADPVTPPGEATANDMMADLLVHRPLGLARTAVGIGVWVVSLPFTVFGGGVGEAGDKLVVEPAQHTFARPLGYMSPVGER